MRVLPAVFLLVASVAATAAPPQYGPWFDRARSGQGLDLQRYGDTLAVGFYSYDDAGEPDWFTAQGSVRDGLFEAPLLRFRNAGTPQRPQATPRTVGTLRLRFGVAPAACNDGVDRNGAAALATLEATIDGATLRWCVEPLLPASSAPESAMDGTWWGGPDDSGWGLTTYFVATPGARVAAQVLYHYDAAGEPRWVIAQSDFDTFAVSARWISYRGYCRACPATALVARDAGPVAVTLRTPLPGTGFGHRLETAAVYPGPNGGGWSRNIELQRISDSIAPARSVATREGLVAGVADAGGTSAWRGLPFAKPPVGSLRLRAPQPADGRDRVLAAGTFGPACPQTATQGAFPTTSPTESEDCLTLNVWAPDGTSADAGLPVMLWIHGGGHVQGSAAEQLNGRLTYDGSQLARRGVLLVSINYRLGALGYGVFRELIGEFPDQPGAGNYGLLDQVAALRWVRDNIARFGGDPRRVTIFGESAGGVSVCALLASPLARGLFAQAIVQSGACALNVPRLLQPIGNTPPAAAVGDRVLQRLGCTAGTARECLRARSVSEILTAAQGATGFSGSGETYGEVVDGHALLEDVGESLRNGNAAAVPLLIGVNEDEATTLVPVEQRPQTPAAYEALVRSRVGELTPLVLQQYPGAAYDPLWRAWTAINSDVAFICPAARAAREHAALGRPAFAYYLTQTLPGAAELGAFHALDIPFLFSDMAQFGPALAELATTMKTLWIGFATTGRPGAAGVPAWPAHPPDRQLGMELRAGGIAPRADYRDPWCGFWARYVRL